MADVIVNTILVLSVIVAGVLLNDSRKISSILPLSGAVTLTPLNPVKVILAEETATLATCVPVVVNNAAERMLANVGQLNVIAFNIVGRASASDVAPPSLIIILYIPNPSAVLDCGDAVCHNL